MRRQKNDRQLPLLVASLKRLLRARGIGYREIAQTLAVSEPTTATPREPPTSRMVSLIALPAPAWEAGTDAMIVVLAGAMTRPIPAPMITMATAMGP